MNTLLLLLVIIFLVAALALVIYISILKNRFRITSQLIDKYSSQLKILHDVNTGLEKELLKSKDEKMREEAQKLADEIANMKNSKTP